VATLLPLRDQAFKLTPLGEGKVGDKAALGVKVSHAGKRDVNLWFDKASGLLLKSEMKIREEGGTKDINQETYYYDYKSFDGVQHPTRLAQKRDGRVYVEGSLSTVNTVSKHDPGVFKMP
jgi:hypothetical protein